MAPEEQQHLLNEHLHQREIELENELNFWSGKACRDLSSYSEYPLAWKDLYEKKGLFFTGYSGNSLYFWTDQAVPVGRKRIREESDQHLWKLKNGWYLAKRDTFGPCIVLGLALIRTEHSYQNDYLKNSFPFIPDLPAEARIVEAKSENVIPLGKNKSDPQAYLLPAPESADGSAQNSPWLPLFPISILLLFLGIHAYISTLPPPRKSRVFLLWWMFLLGLRIFSFFSHWPEPLYLLNIFNPSEYAASNWLPTLGDLLMNSLFLLYSVFLIGPWIEQKHVSKSLLNKALLYVLFSLLFLLGFGTADVASGLIINSSISLDIRDVLNLTLSSYVSFLILGILFGSIFLFLTAIMNRFLQQERSGFRELSLTLLPISLLAGIIAAMQPEAWLAPWIFITVVVFVYAEYHRSRTSKAYTGIILLIMCFAALGNYLILSNTAKREEEKRKVLAVKISAERDPIAESLFLETEEKLLTDSILKSYLRPGTVATGQVRDLAQLYFNGYWEKFSITVNVFGADECPMTALYTTSVSDPFKFDRLIDSVGMPTMSDRFFFLDDGSGRISYMARLPILNEQQDPIPLGTLYIEFQSRYTPEEIGYPELLLDKMVSTRTDLSAYSYARYSRTRLVSHYGSYPYELNDAIFKSNSTEEFTFLKLNGNNHLIYRPSVETLVVLSKPEDSILAILTPFSYLVLFFSLLAFIPKLLYQLVQGKRPGPISFKRRIQLSIVLILFISLILIGGGTIVYIISNSNQKNLKNISEKIHSLLIETSYILGKDAFLDPAKADDVSYALTRQSNVFFSDINIYDPAGFLYASSRSKIFEEGLVSKKINPEAYYQLAVRKSSEFIHEEDIGKLNYLSAYVPLRNNENQVIGYLNLPYFARQNELRKEIATFVVAIVNIYVFLIVLVVIAAIFLSNTVTAPLALIREKLGNIRLGKKNEVLEWRGSDEIADLVEEYNRMVSELADSADKLARSERESAWREMAKQVAHEIKNPLTPMKLSTQMLKRAWEDQAPGFEERLDRYTRNLIEQIDTLSNIATEFSNFAKMPKMRAERVDLSALLDSAVEFHQGENGVSILLTNTTNHACLVHTDKEQMLRVFNNLIRNSIQAIPEDRQGEIKIDLIQEGDFYIVCLKDNGSGIPDDLKERIFSPSFTTKNAGMGLGLALVKNIVESSKGEVWFESEENQGAAFFVKLPVYLNDSLR